MSAVDIVIAAYPLYKTSKCIITPRTNGVDETIETVETMSRISFHWLVFWMTFGMFKIIDGFGGYNLPGYSFVKWCFLLSLYSNKYGLRADALIHIFCTKFIKFSDYVVVQGRNFNLDHLNLHHLESILPWDKLISKLNEIRGKNDEIQ